MTVEPGDAAEEHPGGSDAGSTPDAPDAPDASLLTDPEGWTDPLSGADGPLLWARILTTEDARRRRYGRVATVALVEFTGFDDEGGWLSRDLLLRFFSRATRGFVEGIRKSDYVARIGPSRFAVLLVDTDEVAAINFVDRLRARCATDLGLDAAFPVLIGWANPPDGGSLYDAAALAEARLAEDERKLRGDASAG